ncbi:hypothetical protein BCR35DRAFT_307206 [Leucosporidium creatinivorum]|uniref:Btz domain-containing protein n=1 Tax=Leucosporidium creatinivorum TaxID=106004 RepID=A0A1Y2EPJ9_9BASI|nr:hypothetical protein BCR35DRAFT_307206 [Leucosporidium creatinivorum]
MASATPSDTPTHTQQATAPPAATASTPASSAPKPKTTKPKQRRGKPVKRRGAKIEEDEEQSEDVALQAAPPADASDSDSDFSVGGAPDEDEDDEDEDESEAEGAADPKTPATASTEQLAADSKSSAKALLDGNAAHPSWSEMPAAGEKGAEDLPTLDFASLTPGTLAAVPAAPASKAPPPGRKPSATTSDKAGASTDRPNKREQMLAKREAKSAELKAKDPVAWEAQDKQRKERELTRKKEKSARAKERKREKKLAEQQQGATETAPAPASAPKQDGPSASASASTSTPAPPTGPRAAAQPKPTRPPVPSRPSRTAIQLGLANAESSTSTPAASTSAPTPSAPASRPPPSSRAPPAGPAASRPPHQPNQGPSADYVQAREAYSTRLANDPSYIPRVGKFWSHDDRLASPEVRPLVWRGRGGRGGERGGFVGRGRGRGRGGVRGTEGWSASGGWEQGAPESEEKKGEEGEAVVEEPKKQEERAEKSGGEDTEDDGWGRGEAKKLRNTTSTPSSFASVPAWNHDGFDELQEDRPPSTNGRGRGGFRGRGGRGGWVGSPSHDANGRPIPGAINPRYANLPFHPQHRFPLAPAAPPAAVADAPATEDQTTSRPVAGEASLFDESSGEEKKPAVGVRLPGSAAPPAPAPVELAIKGTAALSLEESTQTEATQTSSTVQTLEASAEQPLRRPSASTGILYSAVPARLPSDDQAPPPPPPTQPPYAPPPHLAHQYHQLPPHLQPQGPPPPFPSQAPPPGQFIPRHASPAFYPHQHQPYYSPDAFPSMPTPGATPPPPPLYPLGPGGQPQAFFAPPRASKIEIKAPGSGTILSASGDAFSPRPSLAGQPPFAVPPPPHQRQPQYSPISSRDGMGTPGSPQMMQQRQQQHQQQQQMHHMAQQYGGYAPSPYEYEQGPGAGGAGPDGSYVPVENGGIVYFVKSPNAPRQPYYSHQPQHPYYDPYAQQQGGGGGYGAVPQQQQQDPAIVMSSGGGYGQQGGQGGESRFPGEAPVYF